jgi:His/Glu/Gln/Arg/opine family amino acid ABC transporter permease subunit
MNIITYLPQILSGCLITLILMFCSVSFGFVLALFFTKCSLSRFSLLRKGVDFIVFFVRGTPLLVQIFLIYYGPAQFTFAEGSPLWFMLRSPMTCAIIAFSLNSACYTTVLMQGVIQSVPKNEILAAYALGMSKWLIMRRVIFPHAFRLFLPLYSNEIMIVLKGTSLASTITLLDLMGVTQKLIGETYETMPFYLLAGVIYLMINLVIMSLFKWLRLRSNIALLQTEATF